MTIRRIFAFLIDAVLANLFSLIPFIGWLIGFFYMLLRDGLTPHGSPGKKIFSLQVTNLSSQPLTYQESVRRNIIFAIPAVFSIIPLIGWIISLILGIIIYVVELLAMSRDAKNQRYGDRWAGTFVKDTQTGQ